MKVFVALLLAVIGTATAQCNGLAKKQCRKKKSTCFYDLVQKCQLKCNLHTASQACKSSPICKWQGRKCIDSNIFQCPLPDKSIRIRPRAKMPSTFNLNTGGKLCTLTVMDGDVLVPVARSYNGNQWHTYSSEWATQRFICKNNNCKSLLPTLSSGDYYLTTFTRDLPAKDVKARFLEQTTFGPTLDEIDTLSSEVAWLKNQIESVPKTSHRAFFRERANYRFEIPQRMGLVTEPCKATTHYRRYAFTEKDNDRYIEFRAAPSGAWYLMMEGQARTVISVVEYWDDDNEVAVPFPDAAGPQDGDSFSLCGRPDDHIGADLYFWHPDTNDCVYMIFDGADGNPVVAFSATDPPTNEVIDLPNADVEAINAPLYYSGLVEELYVKKDLTDSDCADLEDLFADRDGAEARTGRVVAGMHNGNYYLHDSRFILLDNTLENPLLDGGGAQAALTRFEDPAYYSWANEVFQTVCSNAPRTFLNEDHCVLSYDENVCTPLETPDETFYCERWAFSGIFQATGGTRDPNLPDGENAIYIYAVDKLKNSEAWDIDDPCTPGFRSRWADVTDELDNIAECDDPTKLPTTFDPVDQTTKDIFKDLISSSADDNDYVRDVVMPTTGVTGCMAGAYNFTVVVDGRCWQNVNPEHLNVYDFTEWVKNHPGGSDKIVRWAQWGSLGNYFMLDYPSWHDAHRFYVQGMPFLTKIGRLGDRIRWVDLPRSLSENAAVAAEFDVVPIIPEGGGALVCGSPYEVANVPTNYGAHYGSGFDLATDYNTTGFDDLEYQSTTVWMEVAMKAPDQLRQRVAWAFSQILVVSPGSIDSEDQSEGFLTYYDNFVRNAFGNYGVMLKETAYSPMMGEMLTFLQSKSTAYIWEQESTLEYADENFAREIMQLFSIGLYELNTDGTKGLVDGVPVRTYSNFDIGEYARAWTGFDRQNRRGNVEEPSWDENRIDPMQIRLEWRDHLPKMGLNGRYIGDGWPLCSDLPAQHFLKAGATFRLLGTRPEPELLDDPTAWTGDDRPELSSSSALYAALCNPGGGGKCRHVAKVVLSSVLSCTGVECDVNTLRVFKVGDVFYEYIRPPCVNEAFYPNAKLVKTIEDDVNFMCADPTTEVAVAACCSGGNSATVDEVYSGERVTFATANDRCSSLCAVPDIDACGPGGCDDTVHYWTTSPCSLKIKIDLEGRVAIVHASSAVSDKRYITRMVQEDTKVFFRVDWFETDGQPFADDYDGTCASLGCGRDKFDNLCLCDVDAAEQVGFQSLPSADEALSRLHIGAFEPSMSHFASNGQVNAYSGGSSYNRATVFEVTDDIGVRHLFKNVFSYVKVGNGGLKFRNPTHFTSLSDPELRDAHYETDATLDHYLYHKNTGPFLAIRLAQRFGLSNPTPQLVASVATAFRNGQYVHSDGTSFGSSEYGDLAATVAALILDPEMRTPLLDADPAHGSLLEPFLKLVRLFRSLEYEGTDDYPMVVFEDDLQDIIGEEPHKIPTVFSYFKPEYTTGRVAQSGLVVPEAQVLTGPNVVSFLAGTFSFLKYGLERAYNGFESTGRGWYYWEGNNIVGPPYQHSFGYATVEPPTADSTTAVNQMATLLTSGRLSEANRAILRGVYESTIGTGKSATVALINVQQLILTTAEFHTNAVMTSTGAARVSGATPTPFTNRYKAVVHIHLDGGMDSFNLLVPHMCSNDLVAQYEEQRGSIAFTAGERTRIISATNQPCSKFAIHDEMAVLESTYNAGDAVFFANTGVINRNQMTKYNYEDKTVTQLFAHNAMTEEAEQVDPFSNVPGTGVLGRAADVLAGNNLIVNKITVDDPAVAVVGTPGLSPPAITVSRYGASTFNDRPNKEKYFDLEDYAMQLNSASNAQSSVFGETWSNEFFTGVNYAKLLQQYLNIASLSNVWNGKDKDELWYKFNTISKLIQTRNSRGVDRDIFFMKFGGWDNHFSLKSNLREQFAALNAGLDLFVQELKNQNRWDDVAIVFTSDFARTITPNSGDGSDHAWAGMYWMMGGEVNGGNVLGRYPEDITPSGDLNLGRGTILPTTSWDAIWNGVVQWMGVQSSQLNSVLPNRGSVVEPGFKLFTESDLFTARRRGLRRLD